MLRKLPLLLTLLCVPIGLQAQINTLLSKDDFGNWTVTYQFSQPATKLVFLRNPNDSRSHRWQSLNPDIEIVMIGGEEAIVSKSSTPFDAVSFGLTPTYVHLPKEYAPFSPYSDGSLLLHSGRFFVCWEVCVNNDNAWPMTLEVPSDEHVVVNNQVFTGKANWVDHNDGQNVYVGSGQPNVGEHFISIVDPGLPKILNQQLTANLPLLSTLFTSRLGALSSKPTLFASFDTSISDGFGHQGGTLPGQIFMHWYGSKVEQHINTEDTLWFIAHEVAHMYQKSAAFVEPAGEQWIHEGAAELMAAESLMTIEPQLAGYVGKREKQAREECLVQTKSRSLQSQVEDGNFKILYSCGLSLWSALQTESLNYHENMDVFALWREFQFAVEKGAKPSLNTLILALKPYLSATTLNSLKHIGEAQAADFEVLFQDIDDDQLAVLER